MSRQQDDVQTPEFARRAELTETSKANTPLGQSPRILVVAPAWIGDVVISQSLLIQLRRRHPQARIDVLALAWCRPLLARMPEIDKILEFPADHGELRLSALWHLSRSVRKHGYDHAIVLRHNIKSALVPWLAGIPRRTSFLGEKRYGLLNDIRKLDRTRLASRVQEYLALGLQPNETLPTQPPYPSLRVDTAHYKALCSAYKLTTSRPVIGLAPGASYGPAKRWPVESHAALARELIGAGFDIWVFGSTHDQESGQFIADHAGRHALNLCGITSLDDAADLQSGVASLVGGDSGLTHLAASVAPSVVSLYGPTSPGYAPPLNANARQIYLSLKCSPCGQRTCPLGHNNCMTRIDVAPVFDACMQAVSDYNPPSRYTSSVA